MEGQIVGLALVAWNLGNYAFFLIAGRALGPSDYGFAAALLSVVVLASVPCGALQAAVGKAVASAGAGPGGAIYRRSLRAAIRGSTVIGALVGLALIVLEWIWEDLPLAPLLLTLGALTPLPVLLTALGALQGARRFRSFAVGFALWGFPRPLLLLPFVIVGTGVVGPLIATLICVLLATGFAVIASRDATARADPRVDEALWRAAVASMRSLAIALFGIATLTNADVIVAKVGLSDVKAGQFAAAAVLAKAILIVPQAISFVLLPSVARRHAQGRSTARFLLIGVGGTLGASALIAGLCVFIGDPVVRLTFGAEYLPAADVLPAFVLASGLLGVNLVLVNQQAGTGATRFGWFLGALGLLQLLLFWFLHASPSELVLVDAIAGGLGICVHESVTHRSGGSILSAIVSVRQRSRSPTNAA